MIQFTPAALTEVDRLRHRQATPQDYFRIQVQAGGCCGLSYRLGFVHQPAQDDYIIQGGIAIACEDVAMLQGLSVDYAEDLMGGNFRFENPQASSICGCGSSFSAVLRSQ
jgi:iron-sulfur cluster assembly accessory protein